MTRLGTLPAVRIAGQQCTLTGPKQSGQNVPDLDKTYSTWTKCTFGSVQATRPSAHALSVLLSRRVKAALYSWGPPMGVVAGPSSWGLPVLSIGVACVIDWGAMEKLRQTGLVCTTHLRDKGVLTLFQYDYLDHQMQETIEALNLPAFGCDKLFFLDVPVDVGLNRVARRGRQEEQQQCDLEYLMALK